MKIIISTLLFLSSLLASDPSVKKVILNEKKVKDVLIEGTTIYVGMYSDGTKRDGYAQFLCLLIRDYADKRYYIRIVDMQKILRKQGFHTLGSHYCTFE